MLTQKSIATLLGVEVPAISKHLINIFNSGELIENSVVSILEITASDGKNYKTAFLQNVVSITTQILKLRIFFTRQFKTNSTTQLQNLLRQN